MFKIKSNTVLRAIRVLPRVQNTSIRRVTTEINNTQDINEYKSFLTRKLATDRSLDFSKEQIQAMVAKQVEGLDSTFKFNPKDKSNQKAWKEPNLYFEIALALGFSLSITGVWALVIFFVLIKNL